ncbi:MAG: hypothetical protein ABS69_08680 [Nitrosomonadales bacterium SCN 54-20]|mgnify:CR=1 FL=1|nr:MAG: hypothetical protein ABS69_08680 [Nitrosomonadales bacterium SCN 54-20]
MRHDFAFRNLIRSILITAMAFGTATLVQAEKNPSTDAGSSSTGSPKKEQKSADHSKTAQSKKQGNSAQAQDNYSYGKDQTADYWKAQGISAHVYGKDAASDYWVSQGKTQTGGD